MTCGFCASRVLFGGVRHEGRVFCGADCLRNARALALSGQIPEALVREQVEAAAVGGCSICGGKGPVGVHARHRIASLILTSSAHEPRISCRACGLKGQASALVHGLLLGWWGIPGLFLTPVQVLRNVRGMLKGAGTPAELERAVRLTLASQVTMQPKSGEARF